MTPIQPVHKKDHGAAVAALHAGLLFLIQNQSGISENDQRLLQQGLASELHDQMYGDWTAHLVSLWQEQLAERFQLFVNGNVDPPTANALNVLLAELGAPTDGSPPIVDVPPIAPIQPVRRNDKGAAVATLHAGLLFLIRNQSSISAHDRLVLEQGLAAELRDQVYGDWTAHLVSLWQGQLADRFQLAVTGNVNQATADALNIVLAELGAPINGSPPVKVTPFVNSYEFDGASRFRKIIPLPRAAAPLPRAAAVVLPGAYLALGSQANSGLVAMIAENGDVLWSRQYSLSGRTLSFRDGVVAEAGFVLLCGLDMPTADRQAYVVVRIDQSGNLKWARQIRTVQTRSAERVLRQFVVSNTVATEEFLLTGSANEAPIPTWDTIELIRLKADGTVLRSAYLKIGGKDDQFCDAIPFGNGYVLVGDCEPAYAGFLVYIDTALNLLGSWLLTGTGQGHRVAPRAVLALPNRLVLAGCLSPDNRVLSSMIAEIALARGQGGSIVPTLTGASSFSVTDGQDQPTRIAAIGADILVFNQPIAFARPQTVLRFNAALAAQAHYGFDFPAGTQLESLEIGGNDTVLIAGADNSRPPQDHALLIATGQSLDCCKTKRLATPALTRLPVTLQATNANVSDRPATNEPAAIVVTDSVPKVRSLCGEVIETQGEPMVQSPYLALQSAGSDGTDATHGILLRWYLMGALSEHLPKGPYAHTTVNFNKPDDFVTIYRAPWPGSAVPARQLSFATDKPTNVDDASGSLAFETGTATPRDRFYVRFLNMAAYTAARASVDPTQGMAGFLAAYGTNPIEVELRDHLAVACDLDLAPGPAAYTARVETLSVGENRPQADKILTSRRVLGSADGTTPRLIAENMRSIRVACTGTRINGVAFRCYDDVLTYVNQAKQWTSIGRFALTLDQATAYLRLEDPAHTPVHGRWWKFNDGAFVNVNNYRSRWNSPNDGIAAAVQQYVTLSEQDPQATANVTGAESDAGTISVSYLDLLQLAALDYHVARMLGAGHIDNAGIDPQTSYIHVAEYITHGDLADGGGARPVQHLYMSLPTTLAQSRLPLVPDLDGVEYGLSVRTANGTSYALTDPLGYTPDGLARYIRLYPDCRPLYAQDSSFFNPGDIYDLAERSLPILFGVEYRKAGEQTWRKPEIAYDDIYADTAAIAEAMPTPFPPQQRGAAFIHKETEPGIHAYAAYAINIFSRASTLSTVRATDATQFRKANRLLPPSDLKVQLIQEETPLVLTTQSEQDELAALIKSASDPTLVRLTCNYAHVQDATYGFADSIEIFFRRAPPGNVIGGVKAVTTDSNTSMIRIETEPYTYLSTLATDPSTRETVQPTIADKTNFVGGVLVAGNTRYTVIDITWPDPTTGDNPTFLVTKTTSTGVKDGTCAPVIEDEEPKIAVQGLFMAIENMAAAASWGQSNLPVATIQIGDSTWKNIADSTWKTQVESFTRDGVQVSRRLRGVWDTATAKRVAAKQYEITFDNYVLHPHPQATAANPVTWYKGIVRVPVVGQPADDRRALTVLGIGQLPGKLLLIAADDSGEPGDIVDETGVVSEISGVLVNYYPGYKIYLHADPDPDPSHLFKRTAVMPAAGEGSRTTILGARSVDNATQDDAGQPYRSPVGIPQLLSAVEILAPDDPDTPTGLEYATPPDAFAKCTYTLTVTFKHTPFAAAFYRADALSVLRALYSPKTLRDIRDKIFPPENDPFFANRWTHLFGFAYLAGAMEFQAFPLGSSSYALPHPDAEAFSGDTTTPLDLLRDKIKSEVMNIFLPLTQQPLIYSLIHNQSDYVPTNKKQTFRNPNGDVLAPGDPGFDLAPMARRYDDNGVPTVQFTDFTLDGAMNPNTVYFYCVREIGNRMQIGEASPIFGPVKLVNLSPPLAPVLRKITVVPYDVLARRNPEVQFEVVAPSGIDPIAKLRIYRATKALDALSVRSMMLIKEIDITTLVPSADGTLTVADDFMSDPLVPYGDPLFYRLVAVRTVTYKDPAGSPATASASSEPTRILLANLVDIVNPEPPKIALSLQSTTGHVQMAWHKTVHNGTYYVSRLTPSGNWMRLGSVKTNDQSVIFDLPDPLPINDEDGNRIYYRFKVDVENSSGLLNLTEAPITASLDTI